MSSVLSGSQNHCVGRSQKPRGVMSLRLFPGQCYFNYTSIATYDSSLGIVLPNACICFT